MPVLTATPDMPIIIPVTESWRQEILDVSPVVDGYIGDVGYALSLSSNLEPRAVQAFQLELRNAPKLFSSPMTLAQIWSEIDRRITAAGDDNMHAQYPHGVAGRRVFRVKPKKGKHLCFSGCSFAWFSFEANMPFLKMGSAAARFSEHEGSKLGPWAIEPHIGWQGGGGKFEEILVVENSRCYWLADDVPHVREAQQFRPADHARTEYFTRHDTATS